MDREFRRTSTGGWDVPEQIPVSEFLRNGHVTVDEAPPSPRRPHAGVCSFEGHQQDLGLFVPKAQCGSGVLRFAYPVDGGETQRYLISEQKTARTKYEKQKEKEISDYVICAFTMLVSSASTEGKTCE